MASKNRRTAFAAVTPGRQKHVTAKGSEWRAELARAHGARRQEERREGGGAAAAISAAADRAAETTSTPAVAPDISPPPSPRCYRLPFLNSVVQPGPKSQQATFIQNSKSSVKMDEMQKDVATGPSPHPRVSIQLEVSAGTREVA